MEGLDYIGDQGKRIEEDLRDPFTETKGLEIYFNTRQQPSSYLHEAKKGAGRRSQTLETQQYAEATVDLFYDYACETNICSPSKRYGIEDLKTRGQTGDTFRSDLVMYLNESLGPRGERHALPPARN